MPHKYRRGTGSSGRESFSCAGRRTSPSAVAAVGYVAALVCGAAVCGTAQAADAAASQQGANKARQRADASFEEGLRLQRLGNRERACQAFELSVQSEPLPHALLQLGNCAESQAPLQALSYFQQARSLGQQQANERQRAAYVQAAEQRIEKLTVQLSRLQVQASQQHPAGQQDAMRVRLESVGGRSMPGEEQLPQPQVGGEPVWLLPGDYRLLVDAPGYQPQHMDVSVQPGERRELQLPQLTAELPASAPSRTSDATQAAAQAPLSAPAMALEPGQDERGWGASEGAWWPWALVGGGGALVVGGVVVGQVAAAAERRLDDNCQPEVNGIRSCEARFQSDKDKVDTYPVVADALWIGGAVTAGVGAAFLLLQASESHSAQPSSASSALAFDGGCAPSGCSVRVSGAF